MIERFADLLVLVTLLCSLLVSAQAQQPARSARLHCRQQRRLPQRSSSQASIQTPPQFAMPHSWEPFDAYRSEVPCPSRTWPTRRDSIS